MRRGGRSGPIRGAPGVDAVSIGLFEEQWRDNPCKLWNTMGSGSCFPGPVRGAGVPEDHGEGVRLPGVANTAGRGAQTAAAVLLGGGLERVVHRDSYGYRPGRSAQDALATCRQRCWRQDWVLDLDARAFSGSVPHSLLLQAVAQHTAGGGFCAAFPGGLLHRGCCRTRPWCRGRRGPRRVARFRPSGPACSCTRRSRCGWTGSSRTARSGAMRTTLLRTAAARNGPGCGGPPSPGGPGLWAGSCTR
jgi:hypothetical protein